MPVVQESQEREVGGRLAFDFDKISTSMRPLNEALQELFETAALPPAGSMAAIPPIMAIIIGLLHKAGMAFLETRPNQPAQNGLNLAFGLVVPADIEEHDLTEARKLADKFPIDLLMSAPESEIFTQIQSLVDEHAGDLQGDNIGAIYCNITRGFLVPIGETLETLASDEMNLPEVRHVALMLIGRRLMMVN